jgi:hypothetical protein
MHLRDLQHTYYLQENKPCLPCKARLANTPKSVFENPKHVSAALRPSDPNRMTGFRPILSETRAQKKTKMASVAKKHDSWSYDGTRCGEEDAFEGDLKSH